MISTWSSISKSVHFWTRRNDMKYKRFLYAYNSKQFACQAFNDCLKILLKHLSTPTRITWCGVNTTWQSFVWSLKQLFEVYITKTSFCWCLDLRIQHWISPYIVTKRLLKLRSVQMLTPLHWYPESCQLRVQCTWSQWPRHNYREALAQGVHQQEGRTSGSSFS